MSSSFDQISSLELILALKDIRSRAPENIYYNLTVMIPERSFHDRKYILFSDYKAAIEIFTQFVEIYEPEDLIVGEWLYASQLVAELSRRFASYDPFLQTLEAIWETARSRLGGGFLRVGPPGDLTMMQRHELVISFLEQSLIGTANIDRLDAVTAVETLVKEAVTDAREVDPILQSAADSVDLLYAQAMIVSLS